MKDYTEAKCVLNIPKLVKIVKKKVQVEVPPIVAAVGVAKSEVEIDDAASCHSHEIIQQTSMGIQNKPVEEQVEHQEWSLPLRLIVKQKDFVMGKEFKKMEKLDVFISQNTFEPGPNCRKKEQVHHCVMRFNVKEKHNYD
jgi:hypothetical protein